MYVYLSLLRRCKIAVSQGSVLRLPFLLIQVNKIHKALPTTSVHLFEDDTNVSLVDSDCNLKSLLRALRL